MGFFVMVAQRPKTCVLPLWLEPVHRCALFRSPHPRYPLSIVLAYTVATDCWLKLCPVFSTPLC
jgi:hypothetical protein